MFSVGGGNDISIDKKNESTGSCIQSSYDYKGHSNVLTGKCGEDNLFTVKRILVIQMQ